MNTKRHAKFMRYLKETFWNKVVAILLVLTGMLTLTVSHDATALAFMLMIGIPLFFINVNCVN